MSSNNVGGHGLQNGTKKTIMSQEITDHTHNFHSREVNNDVVLK